MGGVSQPPCFWSSTIYHSEFKAACLETQVVQEKEPAKNEALAFNVGFSKPCCVWLETPGIKAAQGCHSVKALSRSVSKSQNLFFSRAPFRTFYS